MPLAQYARRLILGAVLNGVRRADPVPERMRRTLRIADKARYALAQEPGTLPTPGAMERDHAAARARANRSISPQRALARHDAAAQRTPAARSFGGPAEIAFAPFGTRVHAPRDRRPAAAPAQHRVAHYFGEQPLRALVALNVSPQRVSQLHLLALRQLHAELAANADMTASA